MGHTQNKQQVTTIPTITIEVPCTDAGHPFVFAVRQCGGSYKLFTDLGDARDESVKRDEGVRSWLLQMPSK
tara:strand:- start:468 stop:680 length:213 start_codon:yes stop_codon:yes gene_type:complete